jgi:hypothetical protein
MSDDKATINLTHDFGDKDSMTISKTTGEDGIEIELDHKIDENANLNLDFDTETQKTNVTLNVKI